MIPGLRRGRQEDEKFKVTPLTNGECDASMRFCPKKTKAKKQRKMGYFDSWFHSAMVGRCGRLVTYITEDQKAK